MSVWTTRRLERSLLAPRQDLSSGLAGSDISCIVRARFGPAGPSVALDQRSRSGRAPASPRPLEGVCQPYAVLRAYVYRASRSVAAAGPGPGRDVFRRAHGARRRSDQDRILGPAQPVLPDQEESQGPLRASERARLRRGGHGAGAPGAPERRHPALPDGPGGRARRGAIDGDADALLARGALASP